MSFNSFNYTNIIEKAKAKANLGKIMSFISKPETEGFITPITKFYQTKDALETIVIIEDPDGSISIGIARAGRTDIEKERITSEGGIDVAKGRAEKAKILKIPLIERNYLRGIHAMRIGG